MKHAHEHATCHSGCKWSIEQEQGIQKVAVLGTTDLPSAGGLNHVDALGMFYCCQHAATCANLLP